ncbi:MAG: NAD(P)-dependent alcohol dehydrogenase [SAR324 cluster bacterium]|nr:NAD(P)-dependent alcohol dehydrogenase [SAR324 cluster bacterium]
MKVIELQSFGIEGLHSSEHPIPEPGPGQVLIKMKAASLNYRDLLMVLGKYSRKLPLPIVPISDACGEIMALGEGVSRVRKGDRVAPLFFPDWISGDPTPERTQTALGAAHGGCLQEYMVLHEKSVSKVPRHLSDEEVATLPCAALTAWRSLFVEGKIKAGDSVLIQGTGGVSIFGLQFAKMVKAEVILTSSSDEKLEKGRSLGADHLINYKVHEKWYKTVQEITGGRGVDHVIEVGGAGTLFQSLMSLRPGGHVSIIGVLAEASMDTPITAMISKQARVVGISVGNRDHFEEMCRAIEIDQLKPVVSHVLPFDQAIEALKLMEQGGHFGKICLKYS